MSRPDATTERQLQELLITRDTAAFAAADWSRVADDFVTDGFAGFDASGSAWTVAYASLEAYREAWLDAAEELLADNEANELEDQLTRASRLAHADVAGDRAVVHKRFLGTIGRGSDAVQLDRQTVYLLQRRRGRWRVSGFVTGLAPADVTA